MKTVLAPATGTDTDLPVLQAALVIARLFGSHIDVLHARRTASDITVELAGSGASEVSVGIIDKLVEQAAEMDKRARETFDRFVQQEGLVGGTGAASNSGVSIAWNIEDGREQDLVPAYGRTSDLTVIGRPGPEDGSTRATHEAALFESGRPILIPAAKPVAIDTIAIAWKSTREAARALSAAMPIVGRAKRVVILVAADEGSDDAVAADRALTALRRHNANTELRRLDTNRRPAAQVLLSEASELGAGLVVMGGYGHSRLREWVFGGVTESVLHESALPVLMAH